MLKYLLFVVMIGLIGALGNTYPAKDQLNTKKLEDISFSEDIFPLFQTKCNLEECHGKKEKPNYEDYEAIKKNVKRIRKRISDINMPMPPRKSEVKLERSELLMLLAWIKAGAPEN